MGTPRPIFARLIEYLQGFRPPELRILDDRMEATLREMGVTLDVIRKDPWGQQAWACDLLPQVFDFEDWQRIVRGTRQRLNAFELFLQDVYGQKEILRQGVIPIQPVLGSPQYQNVSIGLPRAQNSYLHLSGLCIVRDPKGALTVRHHHFGHAAGISYMMQNRRALARVTPDIFQESSVQSLAQTPQAIMEKLRYTMDRATDEPSVVLLSPGPGSPIYSEHSFLARRMGVPLVQGDDLLVLDDRLYLKTVQGLRRVEAVYTRVADDWLDPLVFRKESRLGVPGLIHCLRKGTVSIFNSIGSQLADDRSLLCFASQIIRYYLAEDPILPTVPTYWLGDLDQREMVLENIDDYEIKPIIGRFVGATEARGARRGIEGDSQRAGAFRGAAGRVRGENGLFQGWEAGSGRAGSYRLRASDGQVVRSISGRADPRFSGEGIDQLVSARLDEQGHLGHRRGGSRRRAGGERSPAFGCAHPAAPR